MVITVTLDEKGLPWMLNFTAPNMAQRKIKRIFSPPAPSKEDLRKKIKK